jgi:hypothetical protein
VRWTEENPLFNWTLGGVPFGFDRAGALASVLAGLTAVVFGVLAVLE